MREQPGNSGAQVPDAHEEDAGGRVGERGCVCLMLGQSRGRVGWDLHCKS